MSDQIQTQVAEPVLTIEQFESWLQGVEEMQDADWHPNATQWKRIREKIAKLCKDTRTAHKESSTNIEPWNSNPVPIATPYRAATPPAAFVHNTTPPVAATSLPVPRAPVGAKPLAVGTTQTPNIDTSAGDYQSQFI